MTKNANGIFNRVALEEAVRQQFNQVLDKLIAQPNNLLLKCVRLNDLSGEGASLSKKELAFLAANYIVKTKSVGLYSYGECDGYEDRLDDFLPPWKQGFEEMAKNIQSLSPFVYRLPQQGGPG